MSAVICPHCQVANAAYQAICHCCSGALPQTPGVRQHNSFFNDNPPGLALQRQREARWAARVLISAATMCALRGVVYPILISTSLPGTFGKVDVNDLRIISYGLAISFFALSFWARKTPLIASVVAMLLYLGTAVPEAIMGEGLIGRGLISKGVMVLLLGRAVMSGLYHNMLGGGSGGNKPGARSQ